MPSDRPQQLNAQQLFKSSKRTAAKHLSVAGTHVLKHVQLFIKDDKSQDPDNKSRLSTAAHHGKRHFKQAVAHAKDHMVVVGDNLRSENSVDRAVGAVTPFVLTTLVAGATAFSLDVASSIVSPIFSSASDVKPDDENNSANASYLQSLASWLPIICVLATTAAYGAVKAKKAARYVGSFFSDNEIHREDPPVDVPLEKNEAKVMQIQ